MCPYSVNPNREPTVSNGMLTWTWKCAENREGPKRGAKPLLEAHLTSRVYQKRMSKRKSLVSIRVISLLPKSSVALTMSFPTSLFPSPTPMFKSSTTQTHELNQA